MIFELTMTNLISLAGLFLGALVKAGNLGAQAAHSSGSSSITGKARSLTLGIFMGDSFSVAVFGGVVLRSGGAAIGFLFVPRGLHARCPLRVTLSHQVRAVRVQAQHGDKGQRQSDG